MDICIYITEILLYFVTKAPCSARGAPRGGQWPATQATKAQGGRCCSEARKLFEFVPSSNCKPFGAPRWPLACSLAGLHVWSHARVLAVQGSYLDLPISRDSWKPACLQFKKAIWICTVSKASWNWMIPTQESYLNLCNLEACKTWIMSTDLSRNSSGFARSRVHDLRSWVYTNSSEFV